MTWRTNCVLVMFVPMKSSPTNFASTKFVQGGFRNNSWSSTDIAVYTSLLNRYHEEGDAFLCHIVTGDEMLIHHMRLRANVRIRNGNTRCPLSKESLNLSQ
jgi:hypothetical protein